MMLLAREGVYFESVPLAWEVRKVPKWGMATYYPKIGITCRHTNNSQVISCDRAYLNAIVSCGGLPFLLPPQVLKESYADYVRGIDGILFPGGEDINPQFFNEDKHESILLLDKERDDGEMALVKEADARRIPVLGLGRGCELMNVARGGSLYQDIPSHLVHAQNHNLVAAEGELENLHEIFVLPGTKLAGILNFTAAVAQRLPATSTHHQSVKMLGKNLSISAKADDGITEAIEDPRMPFFVGLQSHPERLCASREPKWMLLFQSFISHARKFRTSV